MLLVRVVMEYNENGFLAHAENYCGAYTRGQRKGEALGKFRGEIPSYLWWKGGQEPAAAPIAIKVVHAKLSPLQISDADTDVIFEAEKKPLSLEEYVRLKYLVLKSAGDFERLFLSIPDKNQTTLKERQTFYGPVPRTAREMYVHTNNVTSYYVGEIGVQLENGPNLVQNRLQALQGIEALPFFLENTVHEGSYGEEWSLKKVLRRFIWHDRIHARALYRMATHIWGKEGIANPFFFAEEASSSKNL